jgi:hypothetical protein
MDVREGNVESHAKSVSEERVLADLSRIQVANDIL